MCFRQTISLLFAYALPTLCLCTGAKPICLRGKVCVHWRNRNSAHLSSTHWSTQQCVLEFSCFFRHSFYSLSDTVWRASMQRERFLLSV